MSLLDEIRDIRDGKSPEASIILARLGFCLFSLVLAAGFSLIAIAALWVGSLVRGAVPLLLPLIELHAAAVGLLFFIPFSVVIIVPYLLFRLSCTLAHSQMYRTFGLALIAFLVFAGGYGYALYWFVDWFIYHHR